MSVEVLFLGTGDAFGSGGRLQSAAVLRTAGMTVLVDCGASVLSAMRFHGQAPGDIDVIVLTHLHGDHFGGLPFFLMDAHYASRRVRPLTVIGPPDTERRTALANQALFGGTGRLPLAFPVTWVEWEAGEAVELPGLTALALAVAHSADSPCYGVRLSCGGRILAFSGDTEWTEALVAVSADADLFVCECCGYEHAPPGHLDYLTLTRERPRLTCRRLLLTHMGDEMLQRLDTLDLGAASDGTRVTV